MKKFEDAKDTFTDLEAAYKKFNLRIKSIKEEHKYEVDKLHKQIEDLLRQNRNQQEQVFRAKDESKKHVAEIHTCQRSLRQREWELDALKRDLASRTTSLEKIRQEKSVIEQELIALRDEMGSRMNEAPVLESGFDEFELLDLREKLSQYETELKDVTEVRDTLQNELGDIQRRFLVLESERDQYRRQSQTSGKEGSLTVTKYEIQVQNISKQRDGLKQSLEELREEVRKNRAVISRLQREVLDVQKNANTYKEQCAVATHRIDTLQANNQSLDEQLDKLKSEYSKCQTMLEVQRRQHLIVEEKVRTYESRITELECSIDKVTEERDAIQRELVVSVNKLTNR